MTKAHQFKPAPGRIACLVPFCCHTRRLWPGETVEVAHEWICGQHWRLVPTRLKRRRQRVVRLWRKAQRANAGRTEYRARVLYWKLWDKLKAAAIEIAAGITASSRRRQGPPPRVRAS